MRKEDIQIGRKRKHTEEKSSRPVLRKMPCCANAPENHYSPFAGHFPHIYRKESNHPFHFILHHE